MTKVRSMNWLKKTFGKRNWVILYMEKCSGLIMFDLFGTYHNEISNIVLLVDQERRELVCYVTNGKFKKYIDLDYIISHSDGIKNIIDNCKVKN